MPQITVISETITSRLDYVCKVLFEHVLKCNYNIQVTHEELEEGVLVVNYSKEKIDDTIQIVPSGLLAEKRIQEQNITTGSYNNIVTLFHTGTGDLPFDIFSAAFYLLTRYEEYLPFEADEHGRFSAKQSIAYKNNIHDIPIAELWAKQLAGKLGIPFPAETLQPILTIDIDEAWKYKNRGFVRNLGGGLKSLLKLEFRSFFHRIVVNMGLRPDPFHTYTYLSEQAKTNKQKLFFFVLIGCSSKEDTAYKSESNKFRELVQELAKAGDVGIHPSYASNLKIDLADKELMQLQELTGKEISNNRQHYLVLKFPDTYRRVVESGIKYDYSMGWHDLPGFRAGISRPFPYYDLDNEHETKLMLQPFIAMDRTFSNYMGLNPEQAINEIKKLKELVNSVGGQWSMIWHNDSVSNYGEWKGWRKVFEASI